MKAAECVRLLNAKLVKEGWIANCQAPRGGEIFGRSLAPAPWPSSRPALEVAIEALPAIDDDIARDCIVHVAYAIADLRDELAAVRATLSAALSHAHAQHVEITRLRLRLATTNDARCSERTGT